MMMKSMWTELRDITSCLGWGLQPPVWLQALWALGMQGTPPRVCSGQTSSSPAPALWAPSPGASSHRHNAPAAQNINLS